MSRLIASRILLLSLVVLSTPHTSARKGCNFHDIVVMDIELMEIGPPMDENNTYMEVVEKNGRKLLNGTWAFMEDLPLHAKFKWELYALEEGNQLVKRAQGIPTTFCSFLVNEKPLSNMLLKHSDLPPFCPIRKGTYRIYEASPDIAALPCYAPGKSDIWELRTRIGASITGETILKSVHKYYLVR